MLRSFSNKSEEKPCFLGISLLVFCLSVVYQIIFNALVTPIRSLPDEMGAIYLAAKLAGYDWTYVMTHPAQYYGFLWTPLIYPLFLLHSNPYILYQSLLGYCAIIRALPVFISGRMMKKYYLVNNKVTYTFLSFVSVFGTPTRSTSIDNEPLLILLCWIIFYCITALVICENKRKQVLITVCLSVSLSLSMIAHTRAIVFYITTLLTVGVVYMLCKKVIVHIPTFILIGGGGYYFARSICSIVRSYLYPVDNPNQIANTGGALGRLISNNLLDIFSFQGLSSFWDGVSSNLIVTVLFGVGIPFFIICTVINSTIIVLKKRVIKKRLINTNDTYIYIFFPFCGLLLVLLGVSYTWLSNTIRIRNGETDALTRGYFYLRYYGMFFAPMVVSYLATINFQEKKGTKRHSYFILSLFIYSLIVFRLFLNYFSFGFNRFQTDWFYYFAPFSFSFEKWPNANQNGGYYYVALMVGLLFIIVDYYLIINNRIDLLSVLICIGIIYQYSYSVVCWDSPFSHSDYYYNSSNGIYELYARTRLFDRNDKLYCYGKSNAVYYNVQFVLSKVIVISDFPDDSQENYYFLVVTNDIEKSLQENSDKIPPCDGIFVVDENEYIIVRGTEYYDLLIELQLQELDHYSYLDYG